jgi:Ca2+-binding EF-hand superfamily protein
MDMNKPVKIGFVMVIAAAICLLSQISAGAADNVLQALDPDRDGTVDLNEAKTAGAALFDRLDRDHDGTLDARELKGRLSAKELAAADPDRDGTLTKDEYLAVVEKRFAAANPDKDGTLDSKELKSPSGRALLRLLK